MRSEGLCLSQLVSEISVALRIQNHVQGDKTQGDKNFELDFKSTAGSLHGVQQQPIWIYQPI